jgi:multimeric flavodoxin WrbA
MEALLKTGNEVRLKRITAGNDASNSRRPPVLTSIPDISGYDAVILGAPVQGGRLSPVMQTYLDMLPSVRGKKVACFVTQHFTTKLMGSTRAVKQITQAVEQKGSSILSSGIVQWSSKNREEQILQVIDQLCRI